MLDEISVFDCSCGVKNDPDAVFPGQRANRLEIRHRNRLPSGHIDGTRQANVGNFPRTDFFYEFFQRSEIHIALEGML